MMTAFAYFNLTVHFLLELCALAALGYWGYHAGQEGLARMLLTVIAPLLAAVLWGAFVAPRAYIPLPALPRLMVELVVFGAASAGLYAAGQRTAASILVVVYLINRVFLAVWDSSVVL